MLKFILNHFKTAVFKVTPLYLLGLIVLAIVLIPYMIDTRRMSKELLDQRLPKWLSWFDNADPLDMRYGLNGDIPHQYRHQANNIFTIYWMRYVWLAIRNPLNGYKKNVLGIKIKDVSNLMITNKYATPIYLPPPRHGEAIKEYMYNTEDMVTSYEIGDYYRAGTRICKAKHKGKDVWEYYKIIPYSFKRDRCLRIRIGYKFGANPWRNTTDNFQWVFAIQPWKRFLGK